MVRLSPYKHLKPMAYAQTKIGRPNSKFDSKSVTWEVPKFLFEFKMLIKSHLEMSRSWKPTGIRSKAWFVEIEDCSSSNLNSLFCLPSSDARYVYIFHMFFQISGSPGIWRIVPFFMPAKREDNGMKPCTSPFVFLYFGSSKGLQDRVRCGTCKHHS